ncbi:hypothetical protein PHYBOEH_002303 [Phytophthora boehmeriae]|uniref:Uncharacterized protein n=1 Tax=Phytophthora boehmeriae TaxID=109152 RepID=A0A8T1V5G1_9STRA|nr:hypothetical protein PHYBOEH_002303 [Phytophthora boehmeriae]
MPEWLSQPRGSITAASIVDDMVAFLATKAEDRVVRLRACHMLRLVVNRLGSIDDATEKLLREAMLPRLNDKLNSWCRILPTLVNLVVTKEAYQDLMVRIRDTNEDVRYAAFRTLGYALRLADIPINDRAHLLDQGLQDRSARVKRACEQVVLKKWFPERDSSPVLLLKSLDIEQLPEIGSKEIVQQVYPNYHITSRGDNGTRGDVFYQRLQYVSETTGTWRKQLTRLIGLIGINKVKDKKWKYLQ